LSEVTTPPKKKRAPRRKKVEAESVPPAPEIQVEEAPPNPEDVKIIHGVEVRRDPKTKKFILPKDKLIILYEQIWPINAPMWAVELGCYIRHKRKPTGFPRRHHFIEATKYIWPDTKSEKTVVWHPWMEDMLDACLENKYVALAGSASCGKSFFIAIWLIINWMADPTKNLSIATSTTIRDSKKRVWGCVQKLFPGVKRILGPMVKLVDSPTPAITVYENGVKLDKAGVFLIPAEAKKSEETTGKMRGMKAEISTFLGADELTELSPAVVSTAMSNLVNVTHPYGEFHMVAAANPHTYYDPFALVSKPKAGWDSITVEDTAWETEIGGVCLHFDALKNPNFLARENVWPIQRWEEVESAVERLSGKPEFWRDYRAFWCPETLENFVVSGAEIVSNKGDQKVVWGSTAKTKLAGFDPSFVNGGDRAVLRVASYGLSADGIITVSFDESHHLTEDPNDKLTPRNVQIAKKLAKIIRELGIQTMNLGVDATGGGTPFCDLLATIIGRNDFLRVQFGGKATQRPVSPLDETPSDQKYANRVTELWFYLSDLLRANQLRGIDDALAKEFTTRKYDTKRDAGSRVIVEPKAMMKARLGFSPDEADAACIALEVARERLGLSSETGSGKGGGAKLVTPFRDRVARIRKAGSLRFRLNYTA
jgi:hypothetical protein